MSNATVSHINTKPRRSLKERILYAESVKVQLEDWVAGNSRHNTYADECCPDFSCCNPELSSSEPERIEYAARHKEKHLALKEELMAEAFKLTLSISRL